MKKKTVWSFMLALALMVSAIGASTAALAAAPDTAEPATAIATENEDAIWEQIEAIEEKSDAIFQRNAALWEKLDEICNALPDDYDFTNFDEAAFIRKMCIRDRRSNGRKRWRSCRCPARPAWPAGQPGSACRRGDRCRGRR